MENDEFEFVDENMKIYVVQYFGQTMVSEAVSICHAPTKCLGQKRTK